MSIIRSVSPNFTVFGSEDLAGVNYIAALDAELTRFLASLSADGLKESTDRGDTWGAAKGTGQGGPFTTLFLLENAAGGTGTAGQRVIMSPFGSGNNGMYITDDFGVTISKKVISAYGGETRGRGERIIQTKGPNYYLYCKHLHQFGTVFKSSDGGDTWARVGLGGTGYGVGLEVRSNGTVEAFGALTTGFNHYKDTTSEGDSMADQGAFADGDSNWDQPTLRTGYHAGDDVIGIAVIKSGAESRFVFVTVDSAGSRVSQFESGDVGLVAIDYCSAVPGISGKWVVAARTSTKSRWYVSDDGDPTNFTLLKEFDIATAGEGQLSNLVQFGAP